MGLLDEHGYLQPRDCNREMPFPWLLRLNSSSSGPSISVAFSSFANSTFHIWWLTVLPMHLKSAAIWSCKLFPGSCFSGFARVSLYTGTLLVCVLQTWDSPSWGCSEPPLPTAALVSALGHRSHSCNRECVRAAGLSARNRCGRVAEGARMNDWTEANATKAVGGKRRLGISSPTALICSLQWGTQARRGWRGLYSPRCWNPMWFCLGRIFASMLPLGVGKMPWLPVFLKAYWNFLNK